MDDSTHDGELDAVVEPDAETAQPPQSVETDGIEDGDGGLDDDGEPFFTFADLEEYGTEDGDEEDEEETVDEQIETADEDETAAESPEDGAQAAEETEAEQEPTDEPEAVTEPTAAAEGNGAAEPGTADYAAWEREDLDAIAAANPDIAEQLRGRRLRDVVGDPRRFAELRGDPALRSRLTAAEAFTLAGGLKGARTDAPEANAPTSAPTSVTGRRDTGKAHLRPAPGKAAQPAVTVPREIRRMRDDGMFGDGVSDAELLELFRRVT